MDDKNRQSRSDDFNKTIEIKTWAVSENSEISQALSEILRATGENPRLSEDRGILFYLADEMTPIEIIGQDVIRIGRTDEDDDVATLNLNRYHGAVLGVSRYHAEIVYNDGAYYVKDMGSTNGTWINNEKIPPYRLKRLHSTDQLRLGHFNIVVKFVN